MSKDFKSEYTPNKIIRMNTFLEKLQSFKAVVSERQRKYDMLKEPSTDTEKSTSDEIDFAIIIKQLEEIENYDLTGVDEKYQAETQAWFDFFNWLFLNAGDED